MPDLTPTPETIARLRDEFQMELARAATDRDLQSTRDRYLARKGGVIAGLMKAVAAATPEDRPALGRLANALKIEIETRLADKRAAVEGAPRPADALDVTLPGRSPALGRRHPLTLVRDRMEGIFTRMGFAIVEGPEIEDEWHCFDALNMPAEHPARDMQDTMYLARQSGRDPTPRRSAHVAADTYLAMQIRYMQAHEPPVRIVVPDASTAATISTRHTSRCSRR